MNTFPNHVNDVLTHLEAFHDGYYAEGTFRGPSLHFHKRALETGGTPDFERHLEYVYAMLISWGMHRMGRGGSKMRDFETFKNSIAPLSDVVSALRQRELLTLSQADWDKVERVFKSIKVMATGAFLVGHSKVLAHLVPQIAMPIDRNYTLRYLRRAAYWLVHQVDYPWDTSIPKIIDNLVLGRPVAP